MNLFENNVLISHIISGIFSIALSLYICINYLDLFLNGFFWGDFLLFFCALGFFYLLLFYPINFINKSLINLEEENFTYGISDYAKEYKIKPFLLTPVGGGKRNVFYAFIIIILFIINTIFILPIKFFGRLVRRK